jgi:hypothetical protein
MVGELTSVGEVDEEGILYADKAQRLVYVSENRRGHLT